MFGLISGLTRGLSGFVRGVGIYILSGVIFRMLAAFGIGVYTYRGLDDVIRNAFAYMSGYLDHLPLAILQLMRMAEVDTALSIIASGMLSVVVVKMTMAFFGVRT